MPRAPKSTASPSASTKASKKAFSAYKSLSEAIAEHKSRADTKAAKKSALLTQEEIGENDVLFGRGTLVKDFNDLSTFPFHLFILFCIKGGGTNRHPGNVYFRKLVADAQPEYLLCKKVDKSEYVYILFFSL